MQHNQIRQQWLWSCSNFKPHSRPSLSCINSAKSTILMSGIHHRLVLYYLWKCESVSRRSFIGGRRQQLKGLPLIFIHCPSICPTIEHQSKFYNTQSQINPNLQYRQTSALYKSLSLIFIHYPLANTQWHPTDYKTERLKPSTQFCSLSVYMCVFPFRRMLFQCPLI